MSDNNPLLSAIGATHLDETARLSSALHPGASNPVSWSRSVGGVAANVSRAANQSASTLLIAALGSDGIGAEIQHSFDSSHTDTAFLTMNGFATGRYSAVIDQNGELVVGLAATEITEQLTWNSIAAALLDHAVPDTLVIDANLTAKCIADICRHKPSETIAAVAVSPVKCMRLLDQAAAIDILFANRLEAAMLSGRPATAPLNQLSAALVDAGFKRHVLTDGPQCIVVRDESSTTELFPPSTTTKVASVNGAGDALAGASLAGQLLGNSLTESVERYGMPAAEAIVSGKVMAPSL